IAERADIHDGSELKGSNQRPDTLMQDRIRPLDEVLLQRTAGPYIGSEADIARSPSHVRFTPKSGQTADRLICLLCAMSGLMQCNKKSSIRSPRRRVAVRNRQAERLRRFEIEHQLVR